MNILEGILMLLDIIPWVVDNFFPVIVSFLGYYLKLLFKIMEYFSNLLSNLLLNVYLNLDILVEGRISFLLLILFALLRSSVVPDTKD